mmetsp:Transcript_146843/g.208140  ORF Transcript_146843/g.208140 Transcript_146843/m.208140 type:complete len:327 (-) Transcript_146843:31-1011(-)|eukprot:symbB.v1.2.030736.t1/scaffold3495.1/size92607/6
MQCVHFRALFGLLVAASLSGTVALKSKSKEKFGFYFPVHSQIPSTLNVLKGVRKYYPTSPIYLLQDGGNVDFGKLCQEKEYNCIFDRVHGENSRWNPHSWFARFLKATKALGTEYVIYLEPDVLIRKHHQIEPKHDAGGIYDDFNPHMGPETIQYLEKMGRERNPKFNISWIHFGLSGGSYYRSEAILDAFAPKNVKKIDFAAMEKKEGDKTMSSDFSMLVALYARGWNVYPWEETSQHWLSPKKPTDPERKSEKMSAAFEHNHKEHYNDHVPEKDAKLISTFAEKFVDTTCHGCVWYHDADPNQRYPIPSHQPEIPKMYRYPLKA